MNIRTFTFNPFQENTYVIYEDHNDCIIVDPGCYTNEEENELSDFIKSKRLKPTKLINTHCHIDHVLGNKFVQERWGIDLYINKLEIPILESANDIAVNYGFNNYLHCKYPKYFIDEKTIIKLNNTYFQILFTPGHSPGHICLYNKKENILIGGDLIFKESVGRTDLPGGDYNTLIKSIKEKILVLNDKTKIYCGHGSSTILKWEKEHNPFLK
tara:strand:+ start:83 stop:721 length:639 start_codon:yes stop_codon:yes gene_type:complete